MKLYRTDDRVTVAAPLPGLGPEDIQIDVDAQGRRVIEGRLCGLENCGALKTSKDVLVEEWTVGPYGRELTVPATVDAGGATVTYGKGVLVVSMPVAERARPARLRLDRIAPDRGARIGTGAHPVHRPAR